MLKNIIFDVDNTIFDSSSENAIYYKEALEKTKARLQRIEMTNNMIENQSIKDKVNPIYDKSLLDNFDFDDEIEWDMPSAGPKL